MYLTLFGYVILEFVLAHPSKPNISKTKVKKGGVGSVEPANNATGEKGSHGTKRKQGWKGWVILEDPVPEEEFKAHSNSSPPSYGDNSHARRKLKRIKRN